jgi:soluble lytic murein transglycosylase-like protein
MIRLCASAFTLATIILAPSAWAEDTRHGNLDALIAAHARANSIPESLIHRVIVRESRYNPRLIGHGGAMGLMQIKPATARGLGYAGSASGLLDAETNLTYAVRYLAGAYRLAGGNENRAVGYFARGYYYAAKKVGARVEALAQPPSP